MNRSKQRFITDWLLKVYRNLMKDTAMNGQKPSALLFFKDSWDKKMDLGFRNNLSILSISYS